MRENREINYLSPNIQNLIYNLRKLIKTIVYQKISELRLKSFELVKDLDWKAHSIEAQGLENRAKFLEANIKSSICMCNRCGNHDRPMVFRNDGGRSRWLCKQCSDDFFYEEYKINKLLSIIHDYDETIITINGKKLLTCRVTVLTIPKKEISYNFTTIDDFLGNREYDRLDKCFISERTKFWVHCSNLQAWYDYNYDTRLLHRNLAFPLLIRMVRAGDSQAKKVFKEEIVKRYIDGSPSVRKYLHAESFLKELSKEDIKHILDELDLLKELKVFKSFSRIGEICDKCHRYSKNAFCFGKTEEEATFSLTLCNQCMKELLPLNLM